MGSPAPTPNLAPRPAHERAHFVSVGTKLTGAMLVVLIVVTAIAYFEVSRNEREQTLSAKARAATMVTELFAAGVTAPLSFADTPGVREHIALLMANSNVVYGGVWGADAPHPGDRGEKLGESTKGSDGGQPPVAIPKDFVVTRTPTEILVEEPVVGASGEVLGVVRVAFSLQPENAAIAAAKDRTLFTSLAMGLGLAGVLLALTRTLVVRRLAKLANAAKRLGDGEVFDVDVDTNDEVGGLSRAFTSMSEAIATREAHISARNRDLRRVLDNVAEGLMTVKKDGTMSDERSRILDDWFGAPADPLQFFAYFEHFAPATARLLRLGWTALVDDFMPVEVILDQMPRRFDHHERFYELDFLPIWDGPEADQILGEVLVVVRDVTVAVARERAEDGQREAMNVFRKILVDRAGFREFLRSTSRLVDAIEQGCANGPLDRVMRDLHTLKGNAGLYGIENVMALCHKIESRVQEDKDAPTALEVAEIRAAWEQVRTLARELETSKEDDRIELEIDEYTHHLAALELAAPGREIVATARTWANELATKRLHRVVEQARSVARRVGKTDTIVEARANPSTLRLPPDRWAPVWEVFSHVLRNTFDHGVESSAERAAAHKSAAGKVEILLAASRTGVELRVVDDGRGIAWEKVREHAAKLGLPHTTDSDLEEALYVDKMTTRTSATEVSGRGVGMGAVRDVVRACGGSISIETSAGRGTTMRFRFPLAMLESPRRPVPSKAPPKVA